MYGTASPAYTGMPIDMKGASKWARLLVCVAFHMILMGLGGAILIHVYGLARPEKILFFPSFAAAAVTVRL